MRDGVEVFVADGWQVNQIDTMKLALRMTLPAVNRHLVSAADQPPAQFLGERLKAAVICGDAASTQ